ncbi:hypothetical protein CCYA_CCYA08G2245 [Cyanidiococcus yangmingshanensis]|nr:hypothetical protein CCYA_CCYA08G2245 [Cyanidiococcus yangmingshanensis]
MAGKGHRACTGRDDEQPRGQPHRHWFPTNSCASCSATLGASLESGSLRRIVQNPASRLANLIETYEDTWALACTDRTPGALGSIPRSEPCYRFHEYRAGGGTRILLCPRKDCCQAMQPDESSALVERERLSVPRRTAELWLVEAAGAPNSWKRDACAAWMDPDTISAECISPVSRAVSRSTAATSIESIRLHPRDRRLFIPAYRTEPTIRIREGMVVVALHRHLCAVLQPRRVLLQDFECAHARELQKMIGDQLSERQASTPEEFVLLALEVVLGAAVRLNERKLERFELQIKHNEAHTGTQVHRAALEHLRALARQLALVVVRARKLQMALEESLEEGLAETIAAWTQDPTRLDDCSEEQKASAVEVEVQAALEGLIQQSHEHWRSAAALRQRLRGIEEATAIQLAATQTRLWAVNAAAHLWLTTMMLTLIPADFFGMNVALPAFNQASLYWPWLLVFGISLGLGAAFLALSLRYLRRRGLLRLLFADKARTQTCPICETSDGVTASWNTLVSITEADCC